MGEPAPLKENARRIYGDYEAESLLGKGAMGMVYLARHRRIGRRVALKTVQADRMGDEGSDFFRRLQREAEVSASLQHPNIVTLFEVGYENDVVSYLASEYVEGESLLERMRRSKPLPLNEALHIAQDILRGLAHAHARGVVHRDIKPANILLTGDGSAKIADFGIARPLQSSLTEAGALLGTPNYMSPEQVKSSAVTSRSDLFSLGVVLYEMLTGAKPFSGDDLSAILYNIVHSDVVPPNQIVDSVPPAIAEFVRRLMAKTPDERIATAGEALEELVRLQSQIDFASLPTLETSSSMEAAPQSIETVRTASAKVVPGWLFALVTFGMGIGLTAWVLVVHARFETPRSLISPAQTIEFANKRAALAEARRLFSIARYNESIKAYDAYLQQYPHSTVAQQEREDVVRAKAEVALRNRKRSDDSVKAPEEPATKEEPPARKPSFRDRLRRIFVGKPKTG